MILKFKNEAFSRQLPGFSSKTPNNQLFKSKEVFLKNNALSLETQLLATPTKNNPSWNSRNANFDSMLAYRTNPTL